MKERTSLFPSDEALPTWLHTLLLFLIVSPIAGYFLWFGITAIATGHLDPISGPELGQYIVGPAALDGRAAIVGGLDLVVLGCAFLAMALRFSRLEFINSIKVSLPWILIAISILLSVWASSIARTT